jgi:membrane associated rhomboid family serine protease
MVALYFLGSLLEPGIGTPRFLAVYFVSLLAGSFGALLISPDSHTVGASGAVFGLMSAAFIVARHRGVEQLAAQIGFYIILNLFFTLGAAQISVGGHFGGLIGGAFCALLIVYAERRVRRPVELEVLGMLTLAVISVVGAIAVA